MVLLLKDTLIFCFYSYPIGKFLSVIDIPDGKRKLHENPVPQIGGLAIMIPVVLIAFYLSIFTALTKLYITLALASGLITVLGFFDDKKKFYQKLKVRFSKVEIYDRSEVYNNIKMAVDKLSEMIVRQ